MPVLHMICGLPGSGKTTLARRLEAEGDAVRLTPDEWMARIVGDGFDEERRAAVEAIQWELAQRLLALGVDVILESGFWSRHERDAVRDRADELGASVELHYLDVSIEELKERLADRNGRLPASSFRIEPSLIDGWAATFEPLEPDELRTTEG